MSTIGFAMRRTAFCKDITGPGRAAAHAPMQRGWTVACEMDMDDKQAISEAKARIFCFMKEILRESARASQAASRRSAIHVDVILDQVRSPIPCAIAGPMLTVRAVMGVVSARAEWKSFVQGQERPQWLLPVSVHRPEMTKTCFRERRVRTLRA